MKIDGNPNLALCKCGIDMTVHNDEEIGHTLEFAGTRHRCYKWLTNGGVCEMPHFHYEDSSSCRTVTGNLPEEK